MRYGFPALLLLFTVSLDAIGAERWYDQAQVERGGKLFVTHCATCHGENGEGKVADWKKALPDGTYPPPPVNGNGHAWHHSIDILKRQIRDGGKPLGGSMPSFANKLNEQDMLDTIAWLQSKWPEKIYASWAERNQPGAKPAALQPVQKASDPLRHLRRLAGGRILGKPEQSPVTGISQVRVGAETVYLTADGRYAFVGSLLDLQAGRNLTEERKAGIAREVLDAFSNDKKVIFRASGTERAVIDVFTDTSCPYCRKLHAEVPQLQAAGVTVRYIPYPRGGAQGPGYMGLRRVWCAPDRVKAMDDAKHGESGGGPADCADAKIVDQGYRLGEQLGLVGTPTIYLPDGSQIGGYVPASELLRRLGISPG